MKHRIAICSILFVLLTQTCLAQQAFKEPSLTGGDFPLDVTGNVTIIRIVKTPFTVVAPLDKALYFWSYPSSVQALDKGKILEVTQCPEGQVKFFCKAILPDLGPKGEFLGFLVKTSEIVLNVGKAPEPGPGPNPPAPTPDSPLVKSLKAAYAIDGRNVEKVQVMIEVFREIAAKQVMDDRIKTSGHLSGVVSQAMKIGVGDLAKVLPNLRKAVGAYLVQHLPTDPAKQLTPDLRNQFRAEFTTIAKALAELVE